MIICDKFFIPNSLYVLSIKLLEQSDPAIMPKI